MPVLHRWLEVIALFAALVVATAGCAETDASERRPGLFPPNAKVTAYDDGADAEAVRAQLTALRVRFGRGPAAPFTVGQNSLTYAKQRIAEGANAENVVEFSLQGTADEGERNVRSWCEEVKDLRSVRFPRNLLTADGLRVAIAVLRGDSVYYVLLLSPSIDNFIIPIR